MCPSSMTSSVQPSSLESRTVRSRQAPNLVRRRGLIALVAGQWTAGGCHGCTCKKGRTSEHSRMGRSLPARDLVAGREVVVDQRLYLVLVVLAQVSEVAMSSPFLCCDILP